MVETFFFQILVKNYDNDLEALNRQQKQLVEKAEQQQDLDLKFASKKIRADQVIFSPCYYYYYMHAITFLFIMKCIKLDSVS